MSQLNTPKHLAKVAARTLWMRAGNAGQCTLQQSINGDGIALLCQLITNEDREFEIDILNELFRRGSFAQQLYGVLFGALVANKVTQESYEDENGIFLLNHARNILQYFVELGNFYAQQELLTLFPGAVKMLLEIAVPEADNAELLERIYLSDPLKSGAIFRYNEGNFEPVVMEEEAPKLDEFFGFHGVRRSYREQFSEFAKGLPTVPFLVSSLPGHGKTQMTIAYTQAHENLTLILAPESALEEPLAKLVALLKERSDRRFVLFFDDIDTNKLNWYYFRTHVGGAFSLPDNVMMVISSNYEFPPSILSRGRSAIFPTFDDVRCLEMTEEFLATFGFRKPNRNLILLMAARYTEEFGQKRFTELSPRTFRRYLSTFENNIQRRKDMIQLSCNPVITKPDPQTFYEFNIGLMRKLYGNEYIENLLKERLKNL